MTCPGCGGEAPDPVARCRFCGGRLRPLEDFEEEARVVLEALEGQMDRGIAARSDRMLVPAFLAWAASGPAVFLALGRWTGMGVLGRVANALLVLVPGFVAFGWLVQHREKAAERALWKEAFEAEILGFLERTSLSGSELRLLAARVLPKEARLVRCLATELEGDPAP